MTQNPITVRQIKPTEGALLRAIRLRALADSPEAFGSTVAETEARPMSYWDMRACGDTADQESTLFVAEDAGRWIGLAGGFVYREGDDRSADLISMWVDPAYRRRGVGRRLVERVVEWARERGASSVSLWVTGGNSAAETLYTRCGFERTDETQPHPSQPSLHELRMVLPLTPRYGCRPTENSAPR